MAKMGRPVGYRADNTLAAQGEVRRLRWWNKPKLTPAEILKIQVAVHAKGLNIPCYMTVVHAHQDVRNARGAMA